MNRFGMRRNCGRIEPAEGELSLDELDLLHTLNSAFSETCDTVAEDTVVGGSGLEIWIRERLRQRQQNMDWDEKVEMLQESQAEARIAANAATEECLALELGGLADEFSAGQAWLYSARVENGLTILRAIVTHRTNQRGLQVIVEENTPGIIALVARSRKPYLAKDALSDTNYVKCSEWTISELAVPVFDASSGLLLGVLNFESSQHVFSENDCHRLVVMAKRFAVGLLCLQWNAAPHARHWPWTPSHGRWGTATVAQQVCTALVRAVSLAGASDSCSAIVWYADWEKQCLSVKGTTYYDLAYIAAESLTMKSYTGAVAAANHDYVSFSGPDDERFVMQQRASAAGLRKAASSPLFRRRADGKLEERGWGVVHLYFFGENGERIMPRKEEFADLAFLAEEWLSVTERIRLDCAIAYAIWRMEDARLRWFESFHEDQLVMLPGWLWRTIRDLLTDLLDADGCSVFIANDDRTRLLMETSTGVLMNLVCDGQLVVKEPDSAFPLGYTLGNPDDDEYGVLSFLCDNPDVGVIRINDLIEFETGSEVGVPDEVPRRVVRKHLEPLPGDDDNRRFLGMAVKGFDGTPIVVRLVRSRRKPAFTAEDAILLNEVLSLCASCQFFGTVTANANALA